MSSEKKNYNIWYCHPTAGTPERGMAYRPYFLARALCELGVRVHVITAANHHQLFKPVAEGPDPDFERIDGIPYVWLPTKPYTGHGVKRILNMLQYAHHIKKHTHTLLERCGKPTHIIVSSPHPLHLNVCLKLKKQFNCKLIFEVRDLWPLSLHELMNVSVYHPFAFYLQWLENRGYQKADQVVSLLPNALSYMQPHGLLPQHFNYIPNGILLSAKPRPILSDIKRQLESLRAEGKFIVIYTGSHGIANSLDTMIEAMHYLTSTRIHLVMVGDGKEKERLMQKAEVLPNITFLDPIIKPQIRTLLEHADATIVTFLNRELYRFGMSANKLFDYMAACKPIVIAHPCENNLVTRAKCGVYVKAEQPEQLATKLKELAAMSDEERHNLGLAGLDFIKRNHCYQKLGQDYLQVFDKCYDATMT